MRRLAALALLFLAACGADPTVVTQGTVLPPSTTVVGVVSQPEGPSPEDEAAEWQRTVEWATAVDRAEQEAALRFLAETAPKPVQTPTQRPVAVERPVTVSPKPVSQPQKPVAASTGFMACVAQRESGGSYTAVNGSSGAAGKYQMLPSTAANTARHAGRTDLAGRPASSWSPADQEAMAQHLYQWQGSAPWAGGSHPC